MDFRTTLTDFAAKAKAVFRGGDATQQFQADAILNVINGLPGGMGGLLSRFETAGLQEQLKSWTGDGAPMPIGFDQLEKLLGPEALKGIATNLGMNPALASGVIAQILPGLVKKFAQAASGIVPKLHS